MLTCMHVCTCTAVQSALETLRGMSPSLVRQVAPLLEQLAPLYLDLAQGRMEFSPSPEEARHLMQTYYGERPQHRLALVTRACHSFKHAIIWDTRVPNPHGVVPLASG